MFVNLTLYKYQKGREGQTVSLLSYQKNIHNLYLIIDRMLNSFTVEDRHSTYYDNLLIVLEECLAIYYQTILTGKFNHSEDLRLMDSRIHTFDEKLYNRLSSLRYCRIFPVVKFWRNGIKTNSKWLIFLYAITKDMSTLLKKVVWNH